MVQKNFTTESGPRFSPSDAGFELEPAAERMPAASLVEEFERIYFRAITQASQEKEETLGECMIAPVRSVSLRALRPLVVRVSRDDGTYTVYAESIAEFGQGNEFSSAVMDLQRAIAGLFDDLSANDGKLGPEMARRFSVLKEHVAPRTR